MTEEIKTADKFASNEYRRSRVSYQLQCMFEYFIILLVTDSFLAFLLSSIGIKEAYIGIISSISQLAVLFQILTVFFARRIKNVRRSSLLYHMPSDLFFLFIYLIPLIPAFKNYRSQAVIVCIFIAYFGRYFMTSVIYRWGNSFVEPHKRAEFSAIKEMISLVGGIMVTVGLGYVMERCQKLDKIESWFIYAAVSMAVFTLLDLISILFIENRVTEKSEPEELRVVFGKTFGNKKFRKITALSAMWGISSYFLLGFMGTYKNLLFSLSTVQVINGAAYFLRFIFSRPIGIYSDRHSYSQGMRLGFSMVAASFAAVMFTTPKTRMLLVVFTVLFNVGIAGISENMLNIPYDYVEEKYMAEANAISSGIMGIAGFLSSLVAGALFSYIESRGNVIFGVRIHGQQTLALIALILLLITMLYNKCAVGRMKGDYDRYAVKTE
ncbi:MAG: MFS transporter [Clostridiales bacterium]|nr:MFS transporter [Clostridiales bacterium]